MVGFFFFFFFFSFPAGHVPVSTTDEGDNLLRQPHTSAFNSSIYSSTSEPKPRPSSPISGQRSTLASTVTGACSSSTSSSWLNVLRCRTGIGGAEIPGVWVGRGEGREGGGGGGGLNLTLHMQRKWGMVNGWQNFYSSALLRNLHYIYIYIRFHYIYMMMMIAFI